MRNPVVRLLVSVFLLSQAADTFAATITRLSPDEGLGRIAFKHLKMNETGDYVAVTRTKVFVGSSSRGPVTEIFTDERSSFVLDGFVTLSTSDPTNRNITVDGEVYGTRVAINADGDFVLASNTKLYIGNTRRASIRLVADAGLFAELQSVAINDNGQYVAISAKKIISGNVEDERAATLLDNAVGQFLVFDINGYTNSASMYAGDQRLALNASGKFIAITGSAVYHGDVAANSVDLLFEERLIGFKHVALSDSGAFTIVSSQDVFGGSL